jgi:hypothetical protein
MRERVLKDAIVFYPEPGPVLPGVKDNLHPRNTQTLSSPPLSQGSPTLIEHFYHACSSLSLSLSLAHSPASDGHSSPFSFAYCTAESSAAILMDPTDTAFTTEQQQ